MSRKKKRVTIIAAIIIALLLVQLFVAGWLGGLGPFSFLRKQRMARLPGNASAYFPDTVSAMDNSPLEGKTILFLGSSVTEGSASLGNSMAEYLGRRFSCKIVVEAVSGTTLVDNGSNSYVQRLQNNVNSTEQFAMMICQLSTNDATKKKPLGEVSDSFEAHDFDASTIAGAMETIIAYTQKTWGCPVMFYTGSRYESAEYEAMVALLPALREKWGIGIINLWHDDAFNNISVEERKLYMQDDIHPTMAGYKMWWSPEMEKQILAFLAQI